MAEQEKKLLTVTYRTEDGNEHEQIYTVDEYNYDGYTLVLHCDGKVLARFRPETLGSFYPVSPMV